MAPHWVGHYRLLRHWTMNIRCYLVPQVPEYQDALGTPHRNMTSWVRLRVAREFAFSRARLRVVQGLDWLSGPHCQWRFHLVPLFLFLIVPLVFFQCLPYSVTSRGFSRTAPVNTSWSTPATFNYSGIHSDCSSKYLPIIACNVQLPRISLGLLQWIFNSPFY
jgi:hypothetical protein